MDRVADRLLPLGRSSSGRPILPLSSSSSSSVSDSGSFYIEALLEPDTPLLPAELSRTLNRQDSLDRILPPTSARPPSRQDLEASSPSTPHAMVAGLRNRKIMPGVLTQLGSIQSLTDGGSGRGGASLQSILARDRGEFSGDGDNDNDNEDSQGGDIPPAIAELVATYPPAALKVMRQLDLGFASLAAFPLRALTIHFGALTDLDLPNNRLTSFPGSRLVAAMPGLVHLDLSHNALLRLDDIVPLNRLPDLASLAVQGNPFQHADNRVHFLRATLFAQLQRVQARVAAEAAAAAALVDEEEAEAEAEAEANPRGGVDPDRGGDDQASKTGETRWRGVAPSGGGGGSGYAYADYAGGGKRLPYDMAILARFLTDAYLEAQAEAEKSRWDGSGGSGGGVVARPSGSPPLPGVGGHPRKARRRRTGRSVAKSRNPLRNLDHRMPGVICSIRLGLTRFLGVDEGTDAPSVLARILNERHSESVVYCDLRQAPAPREFPFPSLVRLNGENVTISDLDRAQLAFKTSQRTRSPAWASGRRFQSRSQRLTFQAAGRAGVASSAMRHTAFAAFAETMDRTEAAGGGDVDEFNVYSPLQPARARHVGRDGPPQNPDMVETAFAADLRKRMQRDRAKQIYDDQVKNWRGRFRGLVTGRKYDDPVREDEDDGVGGNEADGGGEGADADADDNDMTGPELLMHIEDMRRTLRRQSRLRATGAVEADPADLSRGSLAWVDEVRGNPDDDPTHVELYGKSRVYAEAMDDLDEVRALVAAADTGETLADDPDRADALLPYSVYAALPTYDEIDGKATGREAARGTAPPSVFSERDKPSISFQSVINAMERDWRKDSEAMDQAASPGGSPQHHRGQQQQRLSTRAKYERNRLMGGSVTRLLTEETEADELDEALTRVILQGEIDDLRSMRRDHSREEARVAAEMDKHHARVAHRRRLGKLNRNLGRIANRRKKRFTPKIEYSVKRKDAEEIAARRRAEARSQIEVPAIDPLDLGPGAIGRTVDAHRARSRFASATVDVIHADDLLIDPEDVSDADLRQKIKEHAIALAHRDFRVNHHDGVGSGEAEPGDGGDEGRPFVAQGSLRETQDYTERHMLRLAGHRLAREEREAVYQQLARDLISEYDVDPAVLPGMADALAVIDNFRGRWQGSGGESGSR